MALLTRLALAGLVLLGACAPLPPLPTADERRNEAHELVRLAGWRWEELPGAPWPLAVALGPQTRPAARLTIYIEGDGLAWLGSTRVSPDPTPVRPVGLRLALQDSDPAAWLARPCQYASSPACDPRWWTSHRFAPEVVATLDAALDALKQRTGARELALVGYSGGGALAVLLADRRTDVTGIATVAGNLDPDAWARQLGLARLRGSLNPAEAAPRVSAIPQIHFVGERDTVVPPEVTTAYEARAGRDASRIERVAGMDHACCWSERWPTLAPRLPWRRQGGPY